MIDEQFHIPKVSINQWNAEKYLTIDVRSPLEFEESSLPNAVNVPIFNNEERVKVGTAYKQLGKAVAIKLGLAIYSKKITEIFDTILKLKEQHPNEKVVIVCARGGMRSSTIASTLNMLGMHCYQLDGGFRSYRKLIMDKLENYSAFIKRFFIVSGNTGTRKTVVLQRLKQEGYPIIDLEGLAAHRGSAFGGIGLKARTQKQFDALLVEELEIHQNSPYIIIESESKRIGNIIVPDFIIHGKKAGINIELLHPLEQRVQHLIETYQPNKYGQEVFEAFLAIKKRMQVDIANEIEVLLKTQQYERAFEMLLTTYYDPQYNHASLHYHQINHQIQFTDVNEAVEGVKNVIAKYEYQFSTCEGMA
ncbi:tRNA 2-selenouridine(34) synthase MnmH [Anaerobacillus sp. CMMVII]|uniref:tRNA 2-selenouridine(34) synthase MnmH n=1 Tax=Anaerobacillus sp. CMMVII TaxID=2755588 RepID=UPI0021B70C83|nr:tRNA 2-selenouridine(34) synthase MnmH [Anaerobacillus sp. CMMVII]MCT8139911.1 tRNA 2-selenouridine(34) synthase MnmH [Anaerobacillus sp. CMMVII]